VPVYLIATVPEHSGTSVEQAPVPCITRTGLRGRPEVGAAAQIGEGTSVVTVTRRQTGEAVVVSSVSVIVPA